MTGEGDIDLALNLLTAAATQCYWGDVSGRPAADVLDAAAETGVSPDDPRLVHIQANAAPLERTTSSVACTSQATPLITASWRASA